jgi:hypothetical protein
VGASDAGIALLECEKTACATQWAACAGDLCCNDAFIAGFQCLTNIADGGATNTVPMSVEEMCFGTALSLAGTDTNVSNLEICLLGACNVSVSDGGADGAATDGATTTTDASGDGATTVSDAATTTDASGDGAIEQ